MRQLWAVKPQEKFGSRQHRPLGRLFLKALRETVLRTSGNSRTAPPGLVAASRGFSRASGDKICWPGSGAVGATCWRWPTFCSCLSACSYSGWFLHAQIWAAGEQEREHSCFVTAFCDSFEAGQLPPRLLPAPLPVLVPGPVAHPAHHSSPCQLRNRGCFCLITTLERHKQ